MPADYRFGTTRVGVQQSMKYLLTAVNEEVSKYRAARLLWEFAQNCTLVC
jgi:hypothetical protein